MSALVGSVGIDEFIQSVSVAGSYAYLGSDFGLEIVDISDPTTPSLVGRAAFPNGANGAVAIGNYVYVGIDFNDSTEHLLSVVNDSNPSSPVVVGSYAPNSPPFAFPTG